MGTRRSKPEAGAPPPDGDGAEEDEPPQKQQRRGDVTRPLMLPVSGSVWAAIGAGNGDDGDGAGDGAGEGNGEGDECASTPGYDPHPPQPSRDTCLLLVGNGVLLVELA
jgi:hypothetical protein